MKNLLVLKEHIKQFYGKNEVYLTPLMKFLLALVSLLLINSNWGYMEKLNRFPIVLVAALMCSFLPMNFIILIAALFMLLHLYALSLECAAVVLVLFLVLFLLYFRFSPKDTLVVLLTPLCFLIGIPYVVPLCMGLVGSPISAVSIVCGVAVYYIMAYISGNDTIFGTVETEDAIQKFKLIIDGIMNNKAMIVTMAAFVITLLLVYTIRRLSVNYAWTIAMIAGTVSNIVVLLVGDLMLDTNISILATFLGACISLALAKCLEFLVFHVDYSRTEYTQFEDDEYYYYVKAIPKIMVTAPEKSVKKINTQKKPVHRESGSYRK